MRDMAHLREDMSVMGMRFGFLDDLILKRYGMALKPFYCHLCGECEGTCPNHVAISTINRSLMYAEAYKSHDLARKTYLEIPPVFSASACSGCAQMRRRLVSTVSISP